MSKVNIFTVWWAHWRPDNNFLHRGKEMIYGSRFGLRRKADRRSTRSTGISSSSESQVNKPQKPEKKTKESNAPLNTFQTIPVQATEIVI